ncbi:ABC transporter substrate-binding protein [Halomicroarcula sp. GCM10025710]
MNAYEPLLFYEQGGSGLIPVLAEEVPTVDNGLITNDNQTFEFPLREGVQFHTGGEMTSSDVRFSLDRVRTMNLAPGASNLDVIESIETPDDYTVRITISETDASFLTGTIPSKNMVVVSQEAVENNGGVQEGTRNQFMAQNTAGTGPYQLGQWNRGSNLRYDYFQDYWDPESVGPGGIFMRITTDVSTAVAFIDRGDAHASGYELASVDSFEGTGAEFNYYESLAQLFLFFNFEIPYDRDDMPSNDTVPSSFFQDPNVRQAFGHAVDYEDYIESVWGGNGYISNQPCHLGPLQYYDEDAPNFNYDPDRVEELLREAGYWEEGFTFTMMSENFAEAANAVLYVKDSIENLNDRITINTQTFTESQYVERRNEEPWAFTCDIGGFPAFGPDPAPYYDQLLNGPPGAGGRHQDYIDERFFEAAAEARRSLDPDRRAELSELQTLGYEDPPAISMNGERLVRITLPCVEPETSPVASQPIAKRWDISQCDPIDF